MNIKHLNYFISVAEYLSFTKAAQHHYIAQTAMSQQIISLEKELGVMLFYRNSRTVHLTPAGEVFYKEAKIIVAKSEEAISKTLMANSGYQGNLTIGFMGPNEKRFLPSLIRNFKNTYPNIKLKLVQDRPDLLQESLQDRILDITFCLTSEIKKISEISWENIQRDQICAIMHIEHPLANETRITRSALAKEPFVFFGSQRYSKWCGDHMIQDCVNSGFTPNIVDHSSSMETVFIMVEAGIGITTLPRCFNDFISNNLRFVELVGENEFVQLGIAWMPDNFNPAIPLFLQLLRKLTGAFSNT